MKPGGYERSAHLYDLFDTKENIDFFYHYAAESGEILDVGAGTGRIALPLARRGIDVTCVEPSPAMRREFRRKLEQEPEFGTRTSRPPLMRERINLVAGGATTFDLGRTFPAAFLSGSFDHLLDDEERLVALQNLHRHLRVGGVLVFDLFLGLMKDSPLSPAGTVSTSTGEIRRFVGGRVLPGQRKETLLVFEVYEASGYALVERIEERSLVGLTTREAVHNLLKKVGFEVRQEWGDYDFTPYSVGEPLLIIEAVKVAPER